MSALYTLGRHTVAPVLRGLWRPWTSGLEHIPATGPAILASNHLSACDSLVLPIVAPVPRLGHSIGVRVGPPLDYTSKADGPRNPKLLREITDDIMAHIRRLSGQEYVDRYASREKAAPTDRAPRRGRGLD